MLEATRRRPSMFRTRGRVTSSAPAAGRWRKRRAVGLIVSQMILSAELGRRPLRRSCRSAPPPRLRWGTLLLGPLEHHVASLGFKRSVNEALHLGTDLIKVVFCEQAVLAIKHYLRPREFNTRCVDEGKD